MAEEKPQKKGLGTHAKLWIAEHLMAASLGGLFLILLIGYLLVFAPQLKRIRAANISASLEQERQAKNRYLEELNELAAKYEAVPSERVAAMRTMIPEEDDIPGILAALEASAAASDISLTSVNFARGEPVRDMEGIGTLNINLAVEHASYARFKLFVDALERNLRLFDIRSMDLDPGSASYTVLLRTYVQTGKLLRER